MSKVKFIDEFPFNPKDILSSFDVFGMTSAEFGIYCKILFVSWIQKPQQCYLVLDEHNICELCNINPEEWEMCKGRVLKKFQLTYIDNVPYIHNKVLLGKYNKIIRDEKGKKGEQLSTFAQLINYPFEDFWTDYDKKVGDKNRIIPKWLKLSDADRDAIRADIPKRKAAQPNKQYRSNPEKYINGRLWENEIITNKEPQSKDWNKAANYGTQKNNPV